MKKFAPVILAFAMSASASTARADACVSSGMDLVCVPSGSISSSDINSGHLPSGAYKYDQLTGEKTPINPPSRKSPSAPVTTPSAPVTTWGQPNQAGSAKPNNSTQGALRDSTGPYNPLEDSINNIRNMSKYYQFGNNANNQPVWCRAVDFYRPEGPDASTCVSGKLPGINVLSPFSRSDDGRWCATIRGKDTCYKLSL